MTNFLTRLFKSKATSETEAREERAKQFRAEDTGPQTAQTVVSLIDAFYDREIVQSVRDELHIYKKKIDSNHKDVNSEAALEIFL